MIIWHSLKIEAADKIVASALKIGAEAHKVPSGHVPRDDGWTRDMIGTYNVRVDSITKEKETFLMLKYSGGTCFD